MEFILFILALFIIRVIFLFIEFVYKKIRENREYKQKLKELENRINFLNIEYYKQSIDSYEMFWFNNYHSNKAILKDAKGNPVNICPKCGGYLQLVTHWKRLFIGCSNYPNCKSTKNISEILKIRVK